MAEARERNKKRTKIKNKHLQVKGYDGLFVSTKSRAEKLEITRKQILDRLIKETSRAYITDVDWEYPESAKKRKMQLSNVKDLIVIVRQLGEVIADCIRDEERNEEAEVLSSENVTKLEDARKALKQVGIKADL